MQPDATSTNPHQFVGWVRVSSRGPWQMVATAATSAAASWLASQHLHDRRLNGDVCAMPAGGHPRDPLGRKPAEAAGRPASERGPTEAGAGLFDGERGSSTIPG
jgi:hypothetical protein